MPIRKYLQGKWHQGIIMGGGSITTGIFRQFAMNPTGLPKGPIQAGSAWNAQGPWDGRYAAQLNNTLNALARSAREHNPIAPPRVDSGEPIDVIRADSINGTSYHLRRQMHSFDHSFGRSILLGKLDGRVDSYLRQMFSAPSTAGHTKTHIAQTLFIAHEPAYSLNQIDLLFSIDDAFEFLDAEDIEIECRTTHRQTLHPIAFLMTFSAALLYRSGEDGSLPIHVLVSRRKHAGRRRGSGAPDVIMRSVRHNRNEHRLTLENGGTHLLAYFPFMDGVPKKVELSVPSTLLDHRCGATDSPMDDGFRSLDIRSSATQHVLNKRFALEAMPLFKAGVDDVGQMSISALLLPRADATDDEPAIHHHFALVTMFYDFLERKIAKVIKTLKASTEIGPVHLSHDELYYPMP